jgi:hypothetical protein
MSVAERVALSTVRTDENVTCLRTSRANVERLLDPGA